MIKIKIKKILKIILITLLLLCFGFITAEKIISSIYFNPNKDIQLTNSIFSTTVQMISPSLTGTYVYPDETQKCFSFSGYSQKFYLKKFSDSSGEYENANSGVLNYRFGKASIQNYLNTLNFESLTVQQKVFLEKPIENQDLLWNKILPDFYYEVWFELSTSQSTPELFENYRSLLDNSISRNTMSGVIWIPVKTSDDPNDICIGMSGNFSWHYMNYNYMKRDYSYYRLDGYGREGVFMDSLNFLTEHSNETEMFLKSGLFINAENVNFEERLAYVKENGVNCFGMVVYAKGESLLSLKEDDSLNIIQVIVQ